MAILLYNFPFFLKTKILLIVNMRKTDFEAITMQSILRKKNLPHVKNEVIMLEHLSELPQLTMTKRMSLCLFIGVCTSGCASLVVNDRKRMAEQNTVMIITDESVVNNLHCSDDFDGFGFFLSYDMLQEILCGIHNMSDLFLLTHNHPMFRVNEEELANAREFFEMILERANLTTHRFRHEVVRLLILTMIYDMGNAFDRVLNRGNQEEKQTRAEGIFVEFVQNVKQHYREQRQVQWYANMMEISPKYLCEVVSAVSQRSPNEWIDRFVVSEIRNQLRHTTKRISEIAVEMHFPTQSFLGKYFKDNVGVSPTDYRNGIEQQK